MIGETEIRVVGSNEWIDLYEIYGVSLDETSLSKLMTPAPNKQPTENSSDIMNGKRLNREPGNVRKDERNVQLTINIHARNKDEFLRLYGRFCNEVLDNGYFDLRSCYNPGMIYRMTYVDCQQFSEFMLELGKFTLTLNEPDPTNRGLTDKWDDEIEEEEEEE